MLDEIGCRPDPMSGPADSWRWGACRLARARLGEVVEVRYWAFLSYRHANRQDAERLHHALEEYRIPARLAGRLGPSGAVPRRLHPIFRDRDELTASGQIGAVVEAALGASRALSVLCSPAAAASPWVDAEILAFQRLQPRTPVLCVLLGGEPIASSVAGMTEQNVCRHRSGRNSATESERRMPRRSRSTCGRRAMVGNSACRSLSRASPVCRWTSWYDATLIVATSAWRGCRRRWRSSLHRLARWRSSPSVRAMRPRASAWRPRAW